MTDHKITVKESGRTFSAVEDVSVLDSCLSEGIPVPYNCRSGECGECVVALVSGEVVQLPGADPAVFNDRHFASGLRLACLSYPKSDLSISVQLRDGTDAAIRTFGSTVEAVRPLADSVIEVAVAAPGPIAYRAGQYFEWVVPGLSPNRAYSAACRPGSDRLVFHVRVYPGGKVGGLLTSGGLVAGDTLTLKGPYGTFGLTANDGLPTILVAGGTGLAPIMALLEDAFARGSRRSFRLFCGARRAGDLYHVDTMETWRQRHRNFTWSATLSAEPEGSSWSGARGMVTETLVKSPGDVFGAEAYLCGPPPMIDAAIPALLKLGVERTDIHFDKFTPVG